MLHRLSIFGPPLLLLGVGLAAYIMVVKATTPLVQTLTATVVTPTASTSAQASPSAIPAPTLLPITTTVIVPTAAEVSQWQAESSTTATWRLDPLLAAKQLSLTYGFDANDTFTLSQSSSAVKPTVTVQHGTATYQLTMYQPKSKGATGVWAIQSISL